MLPLRPYLVGIPLLVGVLWPLGWERGRDDFPFSSFPMFTTKRNTMVEVAHVLSLDAAGKAEPVSPDVVANGAVMQAATTIKRAVGHGGAATLCAHVAQRLQGTKAVEVIVATSVFDALTYFGGDRAPVSREVHARCRPAGGAR